MRTSALVLPVLLAGTQAFLDPAVLRNYQSGLKNRNPSYNDKLGLGNDFEDKPYTRLEMLGFLKGLWGFVTGTNEKGTEKVGSLAQVGKESKFNAEELKPKEKFNKENMQYLFANDLLGGVLKVAKKGLNPDMVIDEEGNNTAHLIAKTIVRKSYNNEDNAALYASFGMEIIKQLTTSGIDLSAKNKGGETVEDILNNNSNSKEQKDGDRYLYKQLAFMVQSYKENQMNPMAEIADQKDDDIMHKMFDDPTIQLFNIAEQRNPSAIAIDRVSALIKNGADIYATRQRANMSVKDKMEQDKSSDLCILDEMETSAAAGVKKDNNYYNKSLIETAKENWGNEAADRLIRMAQVRDVVAKSASYYKSSGEQVACDDDGGLTVKKLFSWDIAEKDFKKVITEHGQLYL